METMKAFACRKSGKAPERSSFSQTCSLLSQYLKEKGGIGDLSSEVAKKLEAAKGKSEMVRPPVTTMDLLPNIEKSSGEPWRQKTDASPPTVKPTDILPKFAGFGSPASVEEAIGKADFRKSAPTDPETAQMTIFYAGQVLVFNDFPAEKAKEIMLLASAGGSHTYSGFKPSPGSDKVNPGRSVASSSKIDSTPTINPPQDRVQIQANGSGLPIARRASLNKFFEKRKDRVIAKAPYQVNRPSSPPKPETSNSWLDLEAQTSNQLELKL